MGKPLTLIDYIRLSTDFLARRGIESARLDAEVLLAYVLQQDRVYLYVHFDQPLEPSEVDAYRELIVQRGRRIPVAYLTGEKEFYSRAFRVEPGVLIPRPDTEILVERVVAWAHGRGGPLEIADIGTGSGAIAVTLALELPQAAVWATDVSDEALRVAAGNAERLGASGRVHFLHGPWVEPLDGRQFDAVVANPPYIPSAELERLAPEIRYEPRVALDGGQDGLAAYRGLVPGALKAVRPGVIAAVEVGDGQAETVAQMAERAGWQRVETVKDHAGIDRVVVMERGDG